MSLPNLPSKCDSLSESSGKVRNTHMRLDEKFKTMADESLSYNPAVSDIQIPYPADTNEIKRPSTSNSYIRSTQPSLRGSNPGSERYKRKERLPEEAANRPWAKDDTRVVNRDSGLHNRGMKTEIHYHTNTRNPIPDTSEK
jgi:hypothetical protein